MLRFLIICTLLWLGRLSPNQLAAQPLEHDEVAKPVDVATQLAGLSAKQFLKLVDQSQDSVVVIEIAGRDGNPLGIGTGFVVSEDGLIATNLHVIGEARPIRVRFRDGRKFGVTQIHGTDKTHDVALIRIDEQGLPALPLAESDELKQGQPIFALGNPQGLEHSVVTGIVSGFRDDEEAKELIQLAIPIERGNSGGPLLDMQGRVHGLLTMKSLVTDNLGYAVKVEAVRQLLETPHPIPMHRWLTIGTLNPRLWEPLSVGVTWRQRAGVISVDGVGNGFGGRALCLFKQSPQEMPYELAVDVKVNEEDGAAGLVFHSDSEDVHYGFYPSSGSLRLSRFDGPTVYSWNVLQDVRSQHFRPLEWNRLKVRVSDEEIACYCNDELIFRQPGPTLTSGRIGIVKFRHTTASFKRFRFAKELPSETPDVELMQRIAAAATEIDGQRPPSIEFVKEFANLDAVGQNALVTQADQLERRAAQLRVLASEVYEEAVRRELLSALKSESGEPDLLRAALWIAALDNHDLEVDVYVDIVNQLTDEFKATLKPGGSPQQIVDQFNAFLFQEQGFHGSRMNYYHASNSYLNEVIDDREGLPLTLSILYVELARRVGIDAVGIGLPGHFIVRVDLGDQSKYVDVFEQGLEMTEAECRQRVSEISGLGWRDDYLDPQSEVEIIERMLRNLIRVAGTADDQEAALRYARTILAINPNSVEDRLVKAVICYNTNRLDEGEAEVEWVLKTEPEGIDLARVRELHEAFQRKRD